MENDTYDITKKAGGIDQKIEAEEEKKDAQRFRFITMASSRHW